MKASSFAGLAIAFLPPLVLFLLLQRSFVQALTAGTAAMTAGRPLLETKFHVPVAMAGSWLAAAAAGAGRRAPRGRR